MLLQLFHHPIRSAAARRSHLHPPPAPLRQEVHRRGISRRGVPLYHHLLAICRWEDKYYFSSLKPLQTDKISYQKCMLLCINHLCISQMSPNLVRNSM